VGHHLVQVPLPLIKGGQVLVEEGVLGGKPQGLLVKGQGLLQLPRLQVEGPQVGEGPVVEGVKLQGLLEALQGLLPPPLPHRLHPQDHLLLGGEEGVLQGLGVLLQEGKPP
jgi:hypothetical protein